MNNDSIYSGRYVLPAPGTPAGYTALINYYHLKTPYPSLKMAIGEGYVQQDHDGWRFLSKRVRIEPTLGSQLTFALRYEGINLLVLKKLFEAIPVQEIEDVVKKSITGQYARRIWFLYEWLMDRRLSLDDVTQGNYIPALDPKQQYAVAGIRSPRHRVIDNLPGTPAFCPLVTKTPELLEFESLALQDRASTLVSTIPEEILSRAAAFLLLKDSRASFTIEHESPTPDRLARWATAIGHAGRIPLSKEELLRLQELVIGESVFIKPGFRTEGGFVGEHEPMTGFPIVEHASSRSEDVIPLVEGILAYEQRTRDSFDPVVSAASVAFGFVQVHPFSDGNGRIHRYLIHHILAQRGFNPPGIIFPVSHAMLKRTQEYQRVLRAYSSSILPFIKWTVTPDYNIHVLNETADYYRYFDATEYTLFLYRCVQDTIEHDLSQEASHIIAYDRFRAGLQRLGEMPDRSVQLLYQFLRQHNGVLSKRAKEKEFKELSVQMIEEIEAIYAEAFGTGSSLE